MATTLSWVRSCEKMRSYVICDAKRRIDLHGTFCWVRLRFCTAYIGIFALFHASEIAFSAAQKWDELHSSSKKCVMPYEL